MHFEGDRLKSILVGQQDPVRVFDDGFRLLAVVPAAIAIDLVDGGLVGVGNKNRIRELRPKLMQGWTSAGGSTTIREAVRNESGEKVTGTPLHQHRRVIESRYRP